MWRRPIFVAACRSVARQQSRIPLTASRTLLRRRFASDAKKEDDASAEECAKNLSWMGQLLVSESSVATEWAKSLSPQARAELAQVRRLSSLDADTVPEPSPRDIRLTALNQAIPFVGFGMLLRSSCSSIVLSCKSCSHSRTLALSLRHHGQCYSHCSRRCH